MHNVHAIQLFGGRTDCHSYELAVIPLCHDFAGDESSGAREAAMISWCLPPRLDAVLQSLRILCPQDARNALHCKLGSTALAMIFILLQEQYTQTTRDDWYCAQLFQRLPGEPHTTIGRGKV